MKKIGVLCMFTVVMVMVLSSTVFAEKSDWYNRYYDMSKMKKIAVFCVVPPEYEEKVDGPYIESSYPEILVEKLGKKNIIAEDSLAIENKMKKLPSQSYVTMLTQNPEEADQMFQQYVKDNYSAILTVEMQRYEYQDVDHEGYTYETKETEEIRVQRSDGTWTTTTFPKTVKHDVPAYTVRTAEVALVFSLVDAKTDEVIFSRIESRSSDGGIFSGPNLEKVTKSIAEDFAKDLRKKLQ